MNFRQRWRQTTLSNQLMVITTAIVAFGTFFYVIVAIFQWSLMKESSYQTGLQINKLLEESRRMADTSAETAKHAKSALDTTIAHSHLEQRAWVGISNLASATFDDGNSKVFVKENHQSKLNFVFINTGKTPAINVQTNINTQMLKSDKNPPSAIFPDETDRGTVLQPGMEILNSITVPRNRNATKKEVDDLINGKVVLHITGSVTYTDIFKRPHWSTFCLQICSDLTAFNWCKAGNETDDL
jgi:hypothetical protein